MFKNWFLLASVSCGVGFGSTFLISRNLQQSTLAGLGTVPAVAASLTILSRQRKEEIDRQVARSKQQLQLTNASCSEISAHGQRLQEEIDRQVAKSRLGLDDAQKQEQLFKDRCREISSQGKKLQAGLEKNINSLVLKKQTQESLLVQLDAAVIDKQNNLRIAQAELARIQTQKESEIDSARQSNLALQRINEVIRRDSATKKQLDAQITDLQNRSQSLQAILVDKGVDLREIEYQISQLEERRNQVSTTITDLDKLLQQKQSLLQNTGQQQQQSLQQAISDLLLQKQDQKILLDRLVVNISAEQNKLIKLDIEIRERQANLDKLAINLVETEARKQSAIDSAQKSELALTNIEEKISERQANSDRIAIDLAEIESKRQSIIDSVNQSESILADIFKEISQQSANKEKLETAIFDLQKQRESLQVTIVLPDSISPAILATSEEWEIFFNNDPNLSILKDIKTHGRISISEATRILGSDRSRRGFANKINEYNQDCNLPFNIKIENFNNTDYYIKISENETIIFDSQESHLNTDNQQESQDVILINQEEIQSNGLQDRSNNESRAWDYHFQNDPLLFILQYIDSHENVVKSAINQLLRIRSLVVNLQEEIRRYNSDENLPFLIEEGLSHTGEEIYIRTPKHC